MAMGRLKTERYEACCESGSQQPEQRQSVIKLQSTVVTKHSRPQCLRVISLQSHPEEEFCKYKPEIRDEQTLEEKLPKSGYVAWYKKLHGFDRIFCLNNID